jgi:acyl carrier protein
MAKRARPSRRSATDHRRPATDHRRPAADHRRPLDRDAPDDNAANGIATLVMDTLALACRVERTSIHPVTRLHDLDADSLTLVAVLARIEASCRVELTADDTLALFEARDVAALIAALERMIRSREGAATEVRAGEAARNAAAKPDA